MYMIYVDLFVGLLHVVEEHLLQMIDIVVIVQGSKELVKKY